MNDIPNTRLDIFTTINIINNCSYLICFFYVAELCANINLCTSIKQNTFLHTFPRLLQQVLLHILPTKKKYKFFE